MIRKTSPRKKVLLASVNPEIENRIKDALKKLDKISRAEKQTVKKELINFLDGFRISYEANFDASVEPGEKIRDALSKIALKTHDLKGQITGLSWLTQNKLHFYLQKGFADSDPWRYLTELENAANEAIKSVGYSYDHSGYYMVGYCYHIYKEYSSFPITRDGEFKKFVEDIWYGIFHEDEEGPSGALKGFWKKNPHLFSGKKSAEK
jgi:hypothetical protein